MFDAAAELGFLLQIPVVYAEPPPRESYILSENEITAVKTLEDEDEILREDNWLLDDEDESVFAPVVAPSVPLMDYSDLTPFVWRDGVKDPTSNCSQFLPGLSPMPLQRNSTHGLALGLRPEGSLEAMGISGSSYVSTSSDFEWDEGEGDVEPEDVKDATEALRRAKEGGEDSPDEAYVFTAAPGRGNPYYYDRLTKLSKNKSPAIPPSVDSRTAAKNVNSMQAQQALRQRQLREEYERKLNSKTKFRRIANQAQNSRDDGLEQPKIPPKNPNISSPS